ncbi:tRNA lysidine(34) synthetase TilS [Dryocola sp. LX212]
MNRKEPPHRKVRGFFIGHRIPKENRRSVSA